MSILDKAAFPLFMNEQAKYLVVSQLLRERAARPELPPEQAAKANSVAEYFETLADDPPKGISAER
jgi:hypothetical protein